MRMDVYDFKFFKDEIMRGFRACGVQGEYSNFLMLEDAFKKHMITEDEFKKLKAFNRQIGAKF